MKFGFEVLGRAGWDNSVLVTLDTGQKVWRLALDAGDGCIATLPPSDLMHLDGLLLSHLHMDHIAGFEAFVRASYTREDLHVPIFGPAETTRLLQHRLLGHMWNLVGPDSPGGFEIHDIDASSIEVRRLRTCEAFATAHLVESRSFSNPIWSTPDFHVDCRILDHRTPCLAYHIVEHDHFNIKKGALAGLGLTPGPWCGDLKEESIPPTSELELGERVWRMGDLRDRLLEHKPGQRFGYVTDALLDDRSRGELLDMLEGCHTLVIECAYRDEDSELAEQHHHMTTTQVAHLALDASIEQLVLFHISDRYDAEDRQSLLAEVQAIFPEARFPEHWGELGRGGGA